jgi:general secretion pathway protein I
MRFRIINPDSGSSDRGGAPNFLPSQRATPAAHRSRIETAVLPQERTTSSWCSGEYGFALLEVLVALAIAAIALAVLFRGALDGVYATRVAGRYGEAVALARSHLSASGIAPIAGDREGDDGNGFHWHVRVRRVGSAAFGGSREDATATSSAAVDLFAVTVWVSWQDDRTTREVRLDSERLAMARSARH